MVLWPVKLDAARYPRTSQTHKSRLDDVVIIDEVALLNLVVRHLYASAQLRQYHHLDIFVLYPNSQPLLIHLLVRNRLNDGIGIDHAARTLIDAFLQEYRVLLSLSNFVCWYRYQLSPCFYHNYNATNSFSNSSKLLPFVSGQRFHRNAKAQMQMAL